MTTRAIDFVFFDIGGTLGDRDPHSGDLVPFPSTMPMLTSMRDVLGMRIGVITTLGTLTRADGLQLLRKSGLEPFIDPNGFISEHDNAGTGKPSLAIYKFAADRVG